MTAPERIWAASVTENYGEWQTTTDGLPRPTEYVRADLVAELAAENERLTKQRDDLQNRHDSLEFALDGIKARAEALSRTGAVKELEWDKGVVDCARPLPGMRYVACGTTPAGSWAWWLDDAPGTRAVLPSEAEAKAAAQADYERRILSALEPAAPSFAHELARRSIEDFPVPKSSSLQAAARQDIKSLRDAVVSPEGQQEPVAWLHPSAKWAHCEHDYVANHCRKDGPGPIPLFTRPSEQAVTEAARRYIEAHDNWDMRPGDADRIVNARNDLRSALKAAMEAGG